MKLLIYYVFCGITGLLLSGVQSFFGIMLITPREVGGTLFGGMFLVLMCLGGWLLTTAGLVATILARFAGARVALLCASAIQVIAGIWALYNYPDDAGGNLIFSPAPNEIFCMIAIAGLLLFTSVYLIAKGHLRPKNGRF
ncbi:hypothetical protein NNO04_13355 [Citrobacter sp. Awk 4]|uniref:hypothetical protein n=1 Tax=Citrobacter sp. Awk 4 TaxID=2963955 RepID=UPI0023028A39|nr:hypothetical protein [Citrobacter sp. Awk 4]MDA8479687.1 hypothetical protein [Citrobacter sp. Awk 4]